jgi:Protein of unknown function (DUF3089)
MKKFLIALAVVLLIAGAATFLYRDRIGMIIAFGRLKPAQDFATMARPAAPDYSQPSSWAALPDREDAADVLPGGDVQDLQADAAVDVFFVHPTTYYRPDNWNQPLDDAFTNQLTDMFVLRSQASVFNSCCRIYAPRYRQATLFSFMDGSGSGPAALELAYQDVERAFDHFLGHYNQGRPFILASHSQGSVHIRTLLEKRITGTPLRERMVAAYPIGFSIDRAAMAAAVPDVPVCDSAEQIGCVVSWNAVGPQAQPWGDDPGRNICVNPLTWRADDAHAEHALNVGSVAYPGVFTGSIGELKELPADYVNGKPILETGVADARCVDGMLLVSEIRSQHFRSRPMGRDNYHIYDYNLFHMNLRRNIDGKVALYLAQHADAASTEGATQ